MDKIIVVGGQRLKGEATVSGAKNAALPILASSLLASGLHRYRNVPHLADISTMCRLIDTMGAHSTRGQGDRSDEIAIEIPRNIHPEAPYELVKTMRASIVALGPLVARYGRARISLPGGCAIGARPIDQHLKGLERMGAEILLEHGYVEARAERLRGARFGFDMVTVTGTENLMMAATLAKGETVLENAAREPEIEDLAEVLIKMGARIEGAGSDIIRIQGVDDLRPVEHSVLPDRIEAGTLLVAAAITGGELLLKRSNPAHLDAVLQKLEATGCRIELLPEGIWLQGPDEVRPVDFKTVPYPGFPTDMQAQLMVLLSVASGSSMITESIFENRFMHVQELNRMGADIKVDGRVALVKGVKELSGAPVMATDLRASASLVLAGLRASGTTEVQRVYHLDRGYDRLEQKLQALGARIERVHA